jgi:hypothetical protein
MYPQEKDSLKVYLRCRNDLAMSSFFSRYVPSENMIKVKGARLIENIGNDRIAIIPDSAVVVIEATNKKNKNARLFSFVPKNHLFRFLKC